MGPVNSQMPPMGSPPPSRTFTDSFPIGRRRGAWAAWGDSAAGIRDARLLSISCLNAALLDCINISFSPFVLHCHLRILPAQGRKSTLHRRWCIPQRDLPEIGYFGDFGGDLGAGGDGRLSWQINSLRNAASWLSLIAFSPLVRLSSVLRIQYC